MTYEYEIVKNLDVITASQEEEECCEWGCGTNMDQIAGNY